MDNSFIYVRDSGNNNAAWGFEWDCIAHGYRAFGKAQLNMLSYCPIVESDSKAVAILNHMLDFMDCYAPINVANSADTVSFGPDKPNNCIRPMVHHCVWKKKHIKRIVSIEAKAMGAAELCSELLDNFVNDSYRYPILNMSAGVNEACSNDISFENCFVVFPIFSESDVRFVVRRWLVELLQRKISVN